MDQTVNSDASTGPVWIEIAISALRTVIALVFVFWLLSLTPTKPEAGAVLPLGLLVVGAIAYVLVLRWQLKRVYRAKQPGLLAAESLILSAALFMAIFSAVYVIIEGGSPGSFSEPINHFTALYFTLTVLATVGFGDITAVSDFARLVVMIQMALGLAFLAVIIKVFVGAAQRARSQREAVSGTQNGAAD